MAGFEARLAQEARATLAKRSPLWSGAFVTLFSRALRKDFHAVRLSRSVAPPDPVAPRLVVYSNHPSWWDAAIYSVLAARLFPGRRGYAPIDRAMMSRYRFMARIGAFGVEQNSLRGAAFFMAAAAEILAEPEGLMFVTAQGRFIDARERPIRLAPGLIHLVDRVPEAILVPMALDYPFWDERKPELLVRFGAAVSATALRPLDRKARHAELAGRLASTMDGLATEGMDRKASAFTTLIEGRVGVSGFYDAWRHARAAVGGERFNAAHGEQK